MLAAGCSDMSQRRELGKCAAAGALIGAAVGAGPGYAIADATQGNNHPESRNIAGAVIGAGVGAVIGMVAGHYICDPIPQAAPNAPTLPPPPPQPPPPLPPRAPEKLVMRGVHFDFNTFDIRPGDAAVLDDAVATLRAHPNVIIQVDGYCDAIGGEAYNLTLSQKRAQSVVNYMSNQGVPAGQLVPQGFGKTNFVATNDTADGRAQNRRVELVPQQ